MPPNGLLSSLPVLAPNVYEAERTFAKIAAYTPAEGRSAPTWGAIRSLEIVPQDTRDEWQRSPFFGLVIRKMMYFDN